MTTDVDTKCLETFPLWLRTLGEDGEGLVDLLNHDGVPDAAKRALVGGLNYLFKSLDLIPDGIDDIGYLDDAFVLRVAADLCVRDGVDKVEPEKLATVQRLAGDVTLLRSFLGKDYDRLETYVRGLRKGTVRGRSVEDVVGTAAVRTVFIEDVRGFARGYHAPSFTREEKNLIRLRAFFDAKLPR